MAKIPKPLQRSPLRLVILVLLASQLSFVGVSRHQFPLCRRRAARIEDFQTETPNSEIDRTPKKSAFNPSALDRSAFDLDILRNAPRRADARFESAQLLRSLTSNKTEETISCADALDFMPLGQEHAGTKKR